MRILFLFLMYLITAYEFLLFVRVLLSWVTVSPTNPLVRALFAITEPVLAPVRRLIRPIGGALDISPMVVLLVLELLRRVIIALATP
jgi:YggT family protein